MVLLPLAFEGNLIRALSGSMVRQERKQPAWLLAQNNFILVTNDLGIPIEER